MVGFGGRNDGGVVLKEVRDVLNRIRWDLAEVVGVDFSTVSSERQGHWRRSTRTQSLVVTPSACR